MGYIVDVDELYSVEKAVSSKCNECSSALEKTNDNVNALMDADSFQGDLANNIQTYLKEVHSVILASIAMALTNLQSRCYLYYDGYAAQIDGGLHAYISEDELFRVKRHFYDIINEVVDVKDKLVREAQPVSDLIHLSVPSSSSLISVMENIRNLCTRIDSNIAKFESGHADKDFVDIDDVISNIQRLIDSQMGDKRVKVRDYQAGMVSAMTDVAALEESLQSIKEYQESVADELEAAFEREQQMLQDLDDERQWAKWVATGICIIGSVTLIVVTAGGATPLVCAGVGAAAGLTSVAATSFADNYIATGSFVEGMDWAEFGKDCLIGTVTGAIAGYGGAIAHGSSVVKPLERAMMNTATGVVESGSKGLINFAFDVGAAVVADGATFDSVMTAASDSTENMMKDALVGMAADAAGGFVGGMFDTQAGDKGFLQTVGEKTIENLAEKEAEIGSAVTFDVFTGVTSGDRGIDILNTIDFDMRESTQAFVEDEFSSALSGGIDTAIDNKFKGDKTAAGKIWKGVYKATNKTATDSAGTFMKGATGQLLSGEEVDIEKLWKEDLGGGTEAVKSAAESIGHSVSDEVYSDKKVSINLGKHDYDHDGKVDVVTFKNFSGYSVLKEDYDAAVESAGKTGYKGRRVQDILGIPRNVSLSEENIEVHKYKISSLRESDYSGKGNTNAIKLEHK